MKKIPSFTIDHLHLLRGIYVSRKDYIGNNVVTTFDIRMKEPNREPAIGYGALHTIEHLAATYLRNHPVYGNKIVFWGPMGCCTGNYFLMQGDLSSEDIIDLMKETFRFIRDYKGAVLRELPAARPAYGPIRSRQISTRSIGSHHRKKFTLPYPATGTDMTEEKKPNNDKIIVYSSYNTLSEAYEIKNMLERSGIPCFVSNENMATIYPMFDSEIGGIRLHLFEKDIQAANEILNTAASNGEDQKEE